VHIKTYFIYYLMLTPALVNALPTDSKLTIKTIVEDSNKVRYFDNETFWGFSLGYFPILEEDFESGGISVDLYTENKISKIFKLGWSYQLNIAIDGGGYMAFYGYLSCPLKLWNNNLYIKGGLGLATYTYLTPVAYFKVEYLLWEFEKSAISLSISETIPGIQTVFLPPVISVGILF
jgi:hypothetical protein